MKFNFGLFNETLKKVDNRNKVTKQCEAIMTEYFEQINKIMKNPKSIYLDTEFSINYAENREYANSADKDILIHVQLYRVFKDYQGNVFKNPKGREVFFFERKYLDNPKMAVYMKLKDSFGEKMRTIKAKIKEVDRLVEQWQDNYEGFAQLENEIFGENND